MEIAKYVIPFKGRIDTFHLWFLGDVHAGSANCDEEKFIETIRQIHDDPKARVFLMGDLADYVGRNDWRWDHKGIADWVDEDDIAESERKWVVGKLRPIQGKILGALQGNHELALEKEFEQSVHKRLCEELQIKNLGYMAFVRLRFVRATTQFGRKGKRILAGGEYFTLDGIIHHGWGGGQSDGADVAKLDTLLRDYSVNFVVAGHTHRLWAVKNLVHYLNAQDHLDARVTMKARSGTFLKTIKPSKQSYSERSGMRPLLTGALNVTIVPHLKDFTANI